ncbi:MAG: dihydrodipicolinate synthase family protein, partial [Deltaproteobacteria bacterium]|nr:dihydrodipicolinate synthase family protein [Deltaproteobacteria bacterium]
MTGTKLCAEDLALLKDEFSNIKAVKEATGDFDNMKKIRYFCSENFSIFSGDDANTYKMMTNPDILAAGVISVISNIAPKAIADMVNDKAKTIAFALAPLFNLVTFGASAKTPYGEVLYKFKNPLPIKTAMNILGMPAGKCRRPLGKMTK